MDLPDYLRTLRRNWFLVAAVTLLGLVAGGVASLLTPATYKAETQLFVSIQGSGSVLELQQGNTFTQARVQSYVKTVDSPIVLQPVVDTLGLSTTAAQLASKVQAKSDLNTVLIDISVEDHSPVQAAAIAQGVATSLISAVDSLEKPKAGGSSPIGLSIIKPAVAPTSPSAPNTRLNLLIGLILGVVAGCCVALLRSVLDNRVRGESDLRKVTDAPLLGGIAYDQEASKRPLLTQTNSQGPRAESFRQLRTNLQFANVTGSARSVLITSSLPGEGKSTTAVNLAMALAQAGQTVCLVDADLRRPMVNDYLSMDRNAGLTTALLGRADVGDLLQPWGDGNLYILTSGQIPPNPSELLGSSEMKRLVTRLEETFDVVIIDAPPLLPVTDAAVLSQHVGGVVVVVGSHKLRQADLGKSLDTLQMVESNVLGVVLNRLPAKGPDAYTYSYYGPDVETKRVTQSRKKVSQPQRQTGMRNMASNDTFAEVYSDTTPAPAKYFPGRPEDS